MLIEIDQLLKIDSGMGIKLQSLGILICYEVTNDECQKIKFKDQKKVKKEMDIVLLNCADLLFNKCTSIINDLNDYKLGLFRNGQIVSIKLGVTAYSKSESKVILFVLKIISA